MPVIIQMKNQIRQADIYGRRIEGNQKPCNAYLSRWVIYIDVSAGTPCPFLCSGFCCPTPFPIVLIKFHSFLITCELALFEMIELNSIFLLLYHKDTNFSLKFFYSEDAKTLLFMIMFYMLISSLLYLALFLTPFTYGVTWKIFEIFFNLKI